MAQWSGWIMSAFNPNIDADSIRLRRTLIRIALRKIEGLKLYRPMPFQEKFHASMAHERIVRGANRPGKTTATCAEFARAVTNQDPHHKYPAAGTAYVVGKQGREVAQVLYQKLFKPGAIRMIRDQKTGQWRVYNQAEEPDRIAESRPAPPFIPQRLVKSVAWLDKKLNLPSLIKLKTGWDIHFYSSEGKPTQGSAIDLALFDEEIIDEEWYPEVSARLLDRKGRFIWSATPQAGTERLYALSERAREQLEKDVQPRTIEEFFCVLDDNTYLGDEEKKLFIQKWIEDEEIAQVRVHGQFAILSGRVYPEYAPRLMEIDPFDVPQEWTRYVAIDPGRQVCAALFLAVPPPDEGDFVYLYDELYIRNASAPMFGTEMGKRAQAQEFYTFLIDMNEARKHSVGSGKTTLEYYSDELRKNKARSVTTGYEFMAANDNTKAGIEAARFWLKMRPDGTIKLRVFRTLTNYIKEKKHYRNQRIKGEFIDKPDKKNDHLMDCERYLAQCGPTWVAPKKRSASHSPAYAHWLKSQKDRGSGILLGAGGYDAK